MQIWATNVLESVGGNIPRYPKIKNAITKSVNAHLYIGPRYLIDRTGDLSNQGRRNKIIVPNPINRTPHNFAGTQKKLIVLALRIE